MLCHVTSRAYFSREIESLRTNVRVKSLFKDTRSKKDSQRGALRRCRHYAVILLTATSLVGRKASVAMAAAAAAAAD